MRFIIWIGLILCMHVLVLPYTHILKGQMTDVSAQFRWGPTQKAPNNTYLTKIVAVGRWGAYTLRRRPETAFKPEKTWLESYNRSYQLIQRNEVPLPDGAKLEDVLRMRQQLYALYNRRQEGKSQVWIRPLSPNGAPVKEAQLLTEIPQEAQFRDRQFDLEFNRDSSFLLLYNQFPPTKGGPERYALRVFNDKFEQVWEREVELPYPDAAIRISEYRIDPEGNVYILTRHTPVDANGKRLPAVYLIIAYTRQGQLSTTYKVELEEVWVTSLSFRLASNGDIVCAGLYQAKDNWNEVGICHLRIDPLTKAVNTIHLPSLWTPDLGSSLAEQNFQLRELALRSDGGIVLTAEKFGRTQRASFNANGPAQLDYFSYQDILLVNLAPDGTFTWVRKIPKNQTSLNDGGAFSSFVQATVADRFYFLYNASEARFQSKKRRNDDLLEPKNSVLTLTEIDRKGTMNTVPLLLHADQDIVTMPRWCRQIGARQLLLYGTSGRDYALGIIEF